MCGLTCGGLNQVVIKTASQIAHMYGFSPVWINVCVLKSQFVVNAALQIAHLYGETCMYKCMQSLCFKCRSTNREIKRSFACVY